MHYPLGLHHNYKNHAAFFTDDSCQALTTITHFSWCGTQIISCSRSEVQHGYDILRSSSATANRLVHLISISSPVGDFNISLSTCQPAGVCCSGTKFSSTVKAINSPSPCLLVLVGNEWRTLLTVEGVPGEWLEVEVPEE